MAGEVELASLLVRLRADTSGLVGGLAKGLGEAAKFEKGLTASLNSVATAALEAGAIVAAAAVAIGVGLTVHGMKAAGALATMSDRTGIATEKLAGLQLLAEETGTSTEALTHSMRSLSTIIAEAAADPMSEAANKLQLLKLNAQDLINLPMDEQFGKVADAINGVANSTQRTAVGTMVLGRGYQDLSPLIQKGSKGMNEAAETAERLGLALSRVDAAKVKQANSAFGKIGAVITAVGERLAVALAPYIQMAADALVNFAAKGGQLKPIIEGFVNGAIEGFKALYNIASGVVTVISDIVTPIINAIAAFAQWAMQFEIVRNAVANLREWLQRMWIALQNIDLLVPALRARFADFSVAVAKGFSLVWDAIRYVGEILKQVGAIIVGAGRNIVASFELAWEGVKHGVSEFVSFLEKKLSEALWALSAGARKIKGMKSEADAMAKAAGDLAVKSQITSDESAKSWAEAKQEAAKAGDAFKAAVDELGNVKLAPSKFFQDMISNAETYSAVAWDILRKTMNRELPADKLMKNINEALTKSNASAQKTADNAPATTAAAGGPAKPMVDPQKLQELKDYLATETELENQEYDKRLALIQSAGDAQQLTEQQQREMREKLERDHQEKLADIKRNALSSNTRLERQAGDVQAAFVINNLNAMIQATTTGGKKMFQIRKAAAIATAIMNTYEGATLAYAQYGYPFGIFAAGAVIAAGMAQVSTIAAQSFGGGGGGGSGGGGGAGAAPSLDRTSGAAGNPGGGAGANRQVKQVNITLGDDDEFVTKKAVRNLIARINEEASDGVRVKVS